MYEAGLRKLIANDRKVIGKDMKKMTERSFGERYGKDIWTLRANRRLRIIVRPLDGRKNYQVLGFARRDDPIFYASA